MESHKRTVIKAMSWRVIATLVTFAVTYLITKQWMLATGIGLADGIIKIFAYYFHERVWNRIGFGIKEEAVVTKDERIYVDRSQDWDTPL